MTGAQLALAAFILAVAAGIDAIIAEVLHQPYAMSGAGVFALVALVFAVLSLRDRP